MAFAIAVCLFFCACSEQKNSVSSEALPDIDFSETESKDDSSSFAWTELEDAKKIQLIESAELLTKALTQCTTGFPTHTFSTDIQLNLPSAEDPNSVNQFLYLLAGYQSKI